MNLTRGSFIALALFGVLCLGAYATTRAQAPVDLTGKKEVTVTLTPDGFKPRYLYISRGTRVTFRSTAGTQFWPASDLHPAHTIYPQFDPKGPVAADATWSFIFDKDGHWNFHDHIGLATGAIIVIPPGEKADPKYDTLAPCDEKDMAGRQACWKEHLTFALDKHGLEAQLSEMATLYDTYPEFATLCHSFAHDIGLTAYEKYGLKVPLNYDTLLCGQGFYHGYMEKLIAVNKGDTLAAVSFCAHVAAVLKDSPIAGPQCLHGIGHGTMEYFLSTRPDLMQQLPKMVSLTLDECAKLPNDDGRFRCASGTYAVLKDWITIQNLTAAYTDLFSLQHPFELCKIRPEEWEVRGCAWEMSKEVYTLAHFDAATSFEAELRAGAAWDGGVHLDLIVTSTAFNIGELGVNRDDRELSRSCDVVHDTSLHSACVAGIVLGLIFNADPKDTTTRPLRFCMSDGLDQTDKKACLKQLVASTIDIAGPQSSDRICERIPATLYGTSACSATTSSR